LAGWNKNHSMSGCKELWQDWCSCKELISLCLLRKL
jgi:hypothetical protein